MAKLTEKRALVADDVHEQHTTAPENKRTKRRKISQNTSADNETKGSQLPEQLKHSEKSEGKETDTPKKQGSSKQERKDKKRNSKKTSHLAEGSSNPHNDGVENQLSAPATPWSFARSLGGRFSDIDPLFTADER